MNYFAASDFPQCLLVVYGGPGKRGVSRIPLGKSQFVEMLALIPKNSGDEGFETFIADAMREKLARSSSVSSPELPGSATIEPDKPSNMSLLYCIRCVSGRN